MASRRSLSGAAALAAVLALPASVASAAATISVSPTTSYDGSYAVSWTNPGVYFETAYLSESVNGGTWSRTNVTGTQSRSFTGKALGSYAYKVDFYFFDPELRRDFRVGGTSTATVVVSAPSTPGPITGPTSSATGAYTLNWGASTGTVSRYELHEDGVIAYSGTALSASLSGRSDGSHRYAVRACSTLGCSALTAEFVVTVLRIPPPPEPISAPRTSGSGIYTVTWTKPAGSVVDGYTLERKYEEGSWAPIALGPVESYEDTQKTNGTYRYRVSARNAAGTGSPTSEVLVSVEMQLTETAPDYPPESPVLPAQEWVGTIPGAPSTDGGSAAYRIPIDVPPGRAGMQPQVALAYSSKSGNGIAGVGWSLSGTSGIYRCPRTLQQDGANRPVTYDASDRLCFDGQRLLPTAGDATYGLAGSEYRTEIDQFARITLNGAGFGYFSSYFKVEHKSGRVPFYRALRQEFPAGYKPPDTWQLDSEFDPQGNCVKYEYTRFASRNAGRDEEWVLSGIAYTGQGSSGTCSVGANARRG